MPESTAAPRIRKRNRYLTTRRRPSDRTADARNRPAVRDAAGVSTNGLPPAPAVGLPPPVDRRFAISAVPGITPAGGKTIAPSPSTEYVLSGTMPAVGNMNTILSTNIDRITAQHGGDRVYALMRVDPAVCAATNTLKHGVLSDPVQLVPPRAPKPGAPDPKFAGQFDQDMARRVLEFDRRNLDRLEVPIEDVCWQLLEGLIYGAEIAEIVYDEEVEGPDAGMWMLNRVDPKPRTAWKFVVDPYLRPIGIAARGLQGEPLVLPMAKFLMFNWQPKAGDPRGTSIYEAAFNAWNLKVQCWPELLNYIVRFGTPSLIGVVGEKARGRPQLDDTGTPIPGLRDLSPEEALAADLAGFSNSRAIGVAHGTEVSPVEVKGDGSAHRTAIDLFNREIVLAILNQVRSNIEASKGSRADSQTGQDILGLIIKTIKRVLGRAIAWRLLYPLNVLNFGRAIAERYTPGVQIGEVQQQDLAQMIRALAAAGYRVHPTQFPAIDSMVGIEIRDASLTKASDYPMPGAGKTGPGTQPGGEGDAGTDSEKGAGQRQAA